MKKLLLILFAAAIVSGQTYGMEDANSKQNSNKSIDQLLMKVKFATDYIPSSGDWFLHPNKCATRPSASEFNRLTQKTLNDPNLITNIKNAAAQNKEEAKKLIKSERDSLEQSRIGYRNKMWRRAVYATLAGSLTALSSSIFVYSLREPYFGGFLAHTHFVATSLGIYGTKSAVQSAFANRQQMNNIKKLQEKFKSLDELD